MKKRKYFTKYYYGKLELKFRCVAFVSQLKEEDNPKSFYGVTMCVTVTESSFSALSFSASRDAWSPSHYSIMSTLRRRQHTHERNGGNVLVN